MYGMPKRPLEVFTFDVAKRENIEKRHNVDHVQNCIENSTGSESWSSVIQTMEVASYV